MKILLLFLACFLSGVVYSQVTPAHNYTVDNDSTKFGIGLKTGDIILDMGQQQSWVLLQAYSDLFTLRAAENKLLLNDSITLPPAQVPDTITGKMIFIPLKEE